MKKRIDPFPKTPAGFHLRVEETLMGLEENDMKNTLVCSRRLIAVIAALLILTLSAAAVAVVQGNALRARFSASGGEELAAQVQDVHVSDGDGDFSFTIDEILWEGEDMYFSYTVTAPDDGNAYLYSLDQLKLNDEDLLSGHGLDDDFFVSMFAIGGEYGAEVTDVLRLHIDPEMAGGEVNSLEMQCVFMQTDRRIQKLENDEYSALFTEPDFKGNENQLMKNADILYYTDVSIDGDPAPVIWLHAYPEIRSILDANRDGLSPQDVESTGIAELMKTLEVSIPVQKSTAPAVFFNDVSQHVYPMDGYSIEITHLNIGHFNAEYEAVIRKEAGEIAEWTENEPYGQFYKLCKPDGSEIGDLDFAMGGGCRMPQDDGEAVYCIDGSMGGVFRLEGLKEICLAPQIFDDNGEFVGLDMTRAIKLTPIYNPDLPEPTLEPDIAETDDLSS